MCSELQIMYIVYVFVFIIICTDAEGVSGKAMLCRDPDTGKFYGVNITWPSTTFCGNYHCKLRKKNYTETEYTPLRQINISDYDIQARVPKKEQFFDKDSLFRQIPSKSEKLDIVNINNLIEPGVKDKFISGLETVSKEVDSDRYLNEKEINSIAAILHTLKKSDLDAIVEIYNLAQDIYKEIDSPGPNSLVTQDINNIKLTSALKYKSNIDDKKTTSYWYEPLRNDKRRYYIEPSDMATLGTVKLQVASPTNTPNAKPETKSAYSFYDVTSKGNLFTKIPYYFIMSPFQRLSSYVHQPMYIPQYAQTTSTGEKSEQNIIKYQKIINPSFYLPYPFSYVSHRNWTYPEHNQLKLDRNLNNEKIENAVLINPDLENLPVVSVTVSKSNKEMEAPEKASRKKYEHDWQTDPISAQILKEVRANADKKIHRPVSLRKKITLERVGKVLNLDEVIKRTKRSTMEETNLDADLYEVYIEKTTCQPDARELGYFRYGNMSKGFPDCCPEKILT